MFTSSCFYTVPQILKILSEKVVVGHAVHNDFKVLHYVHPSCLTRDTSKIPVLNKKAGLPEDRPASLKKLTKLLFDKDIQVGWVLDWPSGLPSGTMHILG